ncbi:MAG: hypothetical protein IIC60_00885 [Proteobacteria bacterium]|nr:hypothetical protein [Pseudomonadota bacterium]
MQQIVRAVTSELQNYADRGIFQNFSRIQSADGSQVDFRFRWLATTPFHLKLNTSKPELELRNVLPAVPFRSEMDKAFRAFLIQRCDTSIASHRRLDGSRFAFNCRNRQQNLSVAIGFQARDAGAAAKTAVNLLHEIFNNFLAEGPYQNYMVETFNVPEE